MIDNSNYPENINFVSHFIPPNDIPEYFINADMLVLPYQKIDHSGVLHLAYSFGLPVIGSNVGDLPESIEDGKTGMIFNAGNTDDLSKAMIKASSNKKMVSRMGLHAHEISTKKYSWKHIAMATKRAYGL